MVASVGSTLRSHINKKLSHLDNNRSGFLPVLSKYFDIKDFLGLYEQERTHFFSQVDLDKTPSIVILVIISFEGISSRIYRSIPPPLPFLSNL